MTREDFTPMPKPATCADCDAPWPPWSLDGPAGPWRCMACSTVAAPLAPAHSPLPAEAPAQGSLL